MRRAVVTSAVVTVVLLVVASVTVYQRTRAGGAGAAGNTVTELAMGAGGPASTGTGMAGMAGMGNMSGMGGMGMGTMGGMGMGMGGRRCRGMQTAAASTGSATPAVTTPPPADAVKVAVEAVDFRFLPDVVRVPAGRTVVVTFTNKGTMPHDFTVPDLGVQVAASAGQSATGVVGPFTKGEHRFICSIPGHAQLGMVGRLVVE